MKFLKIFFIVYLLTNSGLFAQKAEVDSDGDGYLIESAGGGEYLKSIITVNPSAPDTPDSPKGIRMTTGTYYVGAPIDIMPGGHINLFAGFGGAPSSTNADSYFNANYFSASASLNLGGSSFNLRTNTINLIPLNKTSDNTIEIKAGNRGLKTTANILDYDSGLFGVKSYVTNLESNSMNIKSYSFILDTSTNGFVNIKNDKSKFVLNREGQFFMFDTANTNGTNSLFTVEGSDLSNYKLFVQGGILTEEVKVQVGWADYVFNNDYKLKPLKEVEGFISKYGHLPNVPSAKEIEKKGLDLGSITKIQQEKIEELTLYIIEMNKKLNQLQETVNQLQNSTN